MREALVEQLRSQVAELQGEKRTLLQQSTKAMHDDIKRLTGKPVLEVLDDISAEEAQASGLRERVYIELQLAGRGADATRPFEPHPKENPALPFSETLKGFLTSEGHQVCSASV